MFIQGASSKNKSSSRELGYPEPMCECGRVSIILIGLAAHDALVALLQCPPPLLELLL